jgi:Spy/CpxP family protein refolding chaperone
MSTKTVKTFLLGLASLCVCGFALAAEKSESEREKPEAPRAIVAGSPHRSPELMGLPHIELTGKQKTKIEEIVHNNQEGVAEVNRAVREAEKALAQAKLAGRPKFIELAAFELGQAIGDRALLNLAIVTSIKEVLSDKQLAKLEAFNRRTQLWLVQGKLSEPEEKEVDKDDDDGDIKDRPER